MAHLIDKDAVLAEIDKLKDEALEYEDKSRWFLVAALKKRIESLQVKEVGLDREMQAFASLYLEPLKISDSNIGISITMAQLYSCAKHFFELGMQVNNPITAYDRGTAEEIIINLKRIEQDYRINLTKEIEWLRNKVKKGE